MYIPLKKVKFKIKSATHVPLHFQTKCNDVLLTSTVLGKK